MKVNKKQGLLYIFNLLKNGEEIKKEKILNDLEIEEYSFWRYLQEIRAFITNFYLPYEIRYSRNKETYYLVEIKN